MYNLVLFGPPGAGKGTQSDLIVEKYNLKHISTGDLFREHIANDTVLGKEVKGILASGTLVPDSITINMLEEEVSKFPEVNGFIFDGFPRTVPQAEALDDYLASKGQSINLVLQLEVKEEEVKKRIEERAKTSGRADDSLDKLIKRIDEYFKKTIHVLPFYEEKGRLVTIHGVGAIEAIFESICAEIDKTQNN